MTSLLERVRITPRFKRSVHLEQDFGKSESIEGYVVSPLAHDTSMLKTLKIECMNWYETLKGSRCALGVRQVFFSRYPKTKQLNFSMCTPSTITLNRTL